MNRDEIRLYRHVMRYGHHRLLQRLKKKLTKALQGRDHMSLTFTETLDLLSRELDEELLAETFFLSVNSLVSELIEGLHEKDRLKWAELELDEED